ncbi:4-alpha-glucanotransferase [Rhodoferax antarcticus]|uniref:4-alpha-glucanotransferase n=1 Tax=Rhodoferax antarcticus ANT.BR TaxID=1111071 RepID=A0A1Q8YL22_9BURK|nr:4-alpha-glucanotransferase [Rhodoferax antarcticus]MCW2311846.1 4-alpha-glucanotransferase [Rhodoferax antarcticus]OLP08685.1 4-alpha-glucanotransferase [Rhodoferax antarcticus ANT.BR]
MPSSLMELRRAGVVLHPTSLPGPHGSGDLGPNAYYFVDWLNKAGQTLWQTLPLSPVGPGFSPYMGSSVFAGNPMLVALEPLVARGWIPAESLQEQFDDLKVDYPQVMPWRMARLRDAYAGFAASAGVSGQQDLAQWAASQKIWLEDYVLFMAMDQVFSPSLWPQWPADLALREPAALAQARLQYADELAFWRFVQWQFDQQWQALKSYAHSKGVLMVGDLPIFVAHHGADCWARPDLYLLDASGQPQVVAGVPPDFFSVTGQRWGNPLYKWEAMHADGYRWWIERVRRQLALADVIRIDHFRGFVDYWEIPADEPTAVKGRWRNGPGDALFNALTEALGPLPIIAEDLGIITDEVVRMRERTGFPGMRVMQFAFSGDAHHPFLPHNFDPNTVVYTGTHDNDTLLGWWASCSAHEHAFALRYLDATEEDFTWALLGAASMSVARLSLCQFQDVLELGTAHRMNVPGTTEGCWSWRFSWDWVTPQMSERLAHLSAASARVGFERLGLNA